MPRTNKKGSGVPPPETQQDITRETDYSTLARVFKPIADREILTTSQGKSRYTLPDITIAIQDGEADGIGLYLGEPIYHGGNRLIVFRISTKDQLDAVPFDLLRRTPTYAEKTLDGFLAFYWLPDDWCSRYENVAHAWPGKDTHVEILFGPDRSKRPFIPLTGDSQGVDFIAAPDSAILDDALREALKGQEKPSVESESTLVPFPEPYPGPMATAVAAGMEAARKPQRDLTTMAVLSAMAATCGSFFQLWDGSRLNLYFLGIAGTGAGKNLPFELAKKLARLPRPIGPKIIPAPGSGQGLEDQLTSNLATYCVVDEIAHFFCIMNDDKASPYMRENNRKLLELFTASTDIYITRALANKKSRTIPYPAFNLLGFTTPDMMGQALRPDDLVNGLIGRMMFVFTENNPPLREVEAPLAISKEFDEMAQRVARRLNYILINGNVIGRTDDAKQLFRTLNKEFDNLSRNSGSTWEAALSVRSGEKVAHIAGVLAAWDNPDKPEITVAHVEWAAQFVKACDACLLRLIAEHMHSEKEIANAKKLRKLLADNKFKGQRIAEVRILKESGGWVPWSVLMRKSDMTKVDFHRAIDYLEALGDIQVDAHGLMKVRLTPGDEG